MLSVEGSFGRGFDSRRLHHAILFIFNDLQIVDALCTRYVLECCHADALSKASRDVQVQFP